jgi:hypothetical protein
MENNIEFGGILVSSEIFYASFFDSYDFCLDNIDLLSEKERTKTLVLV